jgi:hypothetical protein
MAGLRILCTLGALLMMSSSLVAADGYSTFVPATKKLLGVQVPLCCEYVGSIRMLIAF